MKIIKILIFLFTSGFLCQGNLIAQKNRNTEGNWNYHIEAYGTGNQGSYLIKVWSYTEKPILQQELAMKNAVHGILFSGFSDYERIKGQKPLINNPDIEKEHASFFSSFFSDQSQYSKFVQISNDPSVGPPEVIRINKKQYLIGVVASVHVGNLRKFLENEKIISGLSSGF